MQGAAGRVRAKLSAEAAVTGGVKLRQRLRPASLRPELAPSWQGCVCVGR